MTEKIRMATKDDAKAILAIYAPYVKETAITFEYEVPSLIDFEARIIQTLSRYPYLVAQKEDGTIVSQGLGTRLYQALEVELQKLNIIQVLACVTAGNIGSIKFHEKLGYEQVGFFSNLGYKFNEWYDVVWLQKTIQPVTIPPKKFIPYKKDLR